MNMRQRLTANGDARLNERALTTLNQIELSSLQLINNKRIALANNRAAEAQVLDLGPDSRDSLRPAPQNLDTEKLVATVHRLRVERVELERTLRVAESTHVELFGEANFDDTAVGETAAAE
jgi:hypothetical protein